MFSLQNKAYAGTSHEADADTYLNTLCILSPICMVHRVSYLHSLVYGAGVDALPPLVMVMCLRCCLKVLAGCGLVCVTSVSHKCG